MTDALTQTQRIAGDLEALEEALELALQNVKRARRETDELLKRRHVRACKERLDIAGREMKSILQLIG
jgi:vacuolar-type H+-ATPase subunit H